MARDEQLPIAEIARRCDLDRKTVRRCLRQGAWQAYQRPTRRDTLLVTHTDFLRERSSTPFRVASGGQDQREPAHVS